MKAEMRTKILTLFWFWTLLEGVYSICPSVRTPPFDREKLSGNWYVVRTDTVTNLPNCTEVIIDIDDGKFYFKVYFANIQKLPFVFLSDQRLELSTLIPSKKWTRLKSSSLGISKFSYSTNARNQLFDRGYRLFFRTTVLNIENILWYVGSSC